MNVSILFWHMRERKKRLIQISSGFLLTFIPFYSSAQTSANSQSSIFTQPGIIITILLLLIPLLVAVVLVVSKAERVVRNLRNKRDLDEADRFASYLKSLKSEQILELKIRKESLDYKLSHKELSGSLPAKDDKGILGNINEQANIRLLQKKRRHLTGQELILIIPNLLYGF